MELIAAFIVAWVIYQVLALAVGTMPIVSVVSDSMYHGPSCPSNGVCLNNGLLCGVRITGPKSFDDYWSMCGSYYENNSITKSEFFNFLAPNGLSRGDILFVVKPENLKAGDILIYQGPQFTIVHRLVGETAEGYIIKGDNNRVPDAIVPKRAIMGKVVFAVPLLGYPRFLLHLVGI